MTTERMREFLVLSQCLNYKEAAAQLFISQSILSRHIMEMEEESGFKLFIRSTRSVALTEAGKRLAEDLERTVQQCEDTVNRLRSKKMIGIPSIKVGCTDSAISEEYCGFIRRFSEEHQDINLELFVTQGAVPPGKWVNYDFFFSPCTYSNIPRQFDVCHTFRQNAVLLCAVDHRLNKESEVSLASIAGETLLIPCADEVFGPFAKNRQLAEKQTMGNIKIISSFSIPTAILQAELGVGVTIMPESLLRRRKTSKSAPLITDSDCNFDLYMYSNVSTHSRACQIFRENVFHFCEMNNA